MEIVSDVQCFSYTELPTRDLIGPESDDSDRVTSKPEVNFPIADHPLPSRGVRYRPGEIEMFGSRGSNSGSCAVL
jgi:hypothetical protein